MLIIKFLLNQTHFRKNITKHGDGGTDAGMLLLDESVVGTSLPYYPTNQYCYSLHETD